MGKWIGWEIYYAVRVEKGGYNVDAKNPRHIHTVSRTKHVLSYGVTLNMDGLPCQIRFVPIIILH